ncbi:short-chain dehydrogenase/reductase family 16C member 6-like [Planococcus citri]|uniref:short-chain dehydrogenase/reductase family 16C member 6-like n=1 Tax=Planococcus citri TaxID=170843 RepID=UPI0031F9E3A1
MALAAMADAGANEGQLQQNATATATATAKATITTTTPTPTPTTPIDLEPPAPECAKLDTSKWFSLFAQTLYLILIFIPVALYSIVESFFVKPKSLKGNVVLITGSARGLGQGFAWKFAQLGCKLACVDMNETANQQTVLAINKKYGAGTAVAYTCNVALSDEITLLRQRVYRDFGHQVHLLVLNAGLVASTPSITDFDDIYLHGVVTVNLSSNFFMIRAFLPDMMERNQGHIVAVSSLAGLVGIARGSMYVATKHAVMGLMESLHYELEEIPNNRVKTSVICPYFINTSAFYNKMWHIRLPELSIDEVVNDAVAGIRRNVRIITSPAGMYYAINFIKMLPDRFTRTLRQIYYAKLNAPSVEFQKNMLPYKLLIESFKKFKFDFDELHTV